VNVLGIENGETAYANKALFDATDPSTQAFGDSATPGTAMAAARRDHKHAMPAAPTADGLGAVEKSTYNAHTILAATTDDTPAALTVPERTLVGRLTGGNISAVPMDNYNYEYGGRDLSAIFTAAQLHTAVAAGDFSNIRTGDYWPVSLTGTYRDYGVDAGAGYTERTFAAAVVKYHVVPQAYIRYGDTAVPNHLLMVPRDCLPTALKYRIANETWTDATATNPWLGSALYKTLNEPTYGIIALLAATDIGAYIYAGPNGLGMRWLGETKASGTTNATGWTWRNRGKLFILEEVEVWGRTRYSDADHCTGLPGKLPIFEGSTRHQIKGLGNGGSRYAWWCGSSGAGSSTNICNVSSSGIPYNNGAESTYIAVAPCFLIS
jgi:hypothetical protein